MTPGPPRDARRHAASAKARAPGRRPQSAAAGLAGAVRRGSLGRITVEKADGGRLLGSGHPVVAALEDAGFHLTPRGLRMRR